MNFQQEMKARKKMVESALDIMLPGSEVEPVSIHQAMRYAVLNGGKRLRPILVMEGARLGGKDMEKVLPLACAVELIHCFSLVHDDLPAMDDDDLRRGKPTCHKVFGEAMAILAGDALLVRAFELSANMLQDSSLPTENVLWAWNELATATGSRGMIAGQVIDLESENKSVDGDTLRVMHQKKTGALIKAALKSGAIVSGADEEQLQALEEFAGHFGLAFQITDDILDVEGDERITGKKSGSDAAGNKATYVSVFGLSRANQMAEECIEQAIRSLDIFGEEGWFLKELARSVLGRRS
ncbi:MAG: polyprenyl synthetase family protein [Syntrophomonadaceae bacterium]|jgi:geranylgeranyl diphosphate synthase type II|nr:polyprenyl synthetase family protein [Syntrophomonadaceae bacterium]